MKIPGLSIPLSESAKRNLCLLPAVVALLGVLLKEACTARRPPPPAPPAPPASVAPGTPPA